MRGQTTSLAIVARDQYGIILWARMKKLSIGDSEVIEASAILWAIHLDNVIIEGDAKMCIVV
jgi:hypothetical protein